MAQKVHYNPEAPEMEFLGGRVAETCGAITHHNTRDQKYVVETCRVDRVTCKNCIRKIKEKND